jgi:hypothetical protein
VDDVETLPIDHDISDGDDDYEEEEAYYEEVSPNRGGGHP